MSLIHNPVVFPAYFELEKIYFSEIFDGDLSI